jgi:hypothetical protein
MSDAIEGADVMLYGVSLRYKESANVRFIITLHYIIIHCIALHRPYSIVVRARASLCLQV